MKAKLLGRNTCKETGTVTLAESNKGITRVCSMFGPSCR